MNTIVKLAAFALAFLAMAVCSAEASADSSTAEVAALHAVDQVWFKAYKAGDADTIAKLYAKDALLMPPSASAARGRSAIHAYLMKDMAASAKAGLTLRMKPHSDGGVSGNLGWVSGTYEAVDKTGKVVDTGKFLSVSKKVAGKWLYIRDTWNSDLPPAPAEPASAEK